jgi:hypothetical protein
MRALLVSCVFASSVFAQPPVPKPPEPPAAEDSLTAPLGSPAHKSVKAIFETWNTSHTRARAAITAQTNVYRARKEPAPPVVHYAAAIVMMQIGAYAAPDVENLHLPKLGDHPLGLLVKSRIAIRNQEDAEAVKLAAKATADKRAGTLAEAMHEAAVAMSSPDAVGKKKGSKKSTQSQVAELVVGAIADAKKKSDEDLEDERSEMHALDARYKASGQELVSLRRELDLIQSRTVGVDALGFRGYYLNGFEKAADYNRVQQRIRAVEVERKQAEVRHTQLKQFEAAEVAKLQWRTWSAKLPWSVEEERDRLLSGKSPTQYYDDNWEYKPGLPKDLPKQIPQPYKAKGKKK